MLNSKLLYSLVTACLLAVGSAAHAAVYDFGRLSYASSGYAAPDSFASDPFAQLEATDSGGGVWNFMLTVKDNFASNFGDSAFIRLAMLDYTINPASLPASTFTGSNAGGIASVSSMNPNVANIDFRTLFGSAGNRLAQDDWVTWTVSGLNPASNLVLDNLYLVVASDENLTNLAKYGALPAVTTNLAFAPVVSAVPEPGTYAMLLAGLGLIGFSARRRT